jgi:hypothetical protein
MKQGIGLPLVVVTMLGLAACGTQDQDRAVGDPATTPAAETGPGMAPAPDATDPAATTPGTAAPGTMTPGATTPGAAAPGTPGAPGTMPHDTLHQPGMDPSAPGTTGRP